MKAKVLKTIRKYNMFSAGDTVLVALSGGADSMCLTDILCRLRDETAISIKACHVNHCIRGQEADNDEIFVRKFCEDRGIELSVLRADIPLIAAASSESIELCARRIRYEYFASVEADVVATAHTASDRIETMLMNLTRGTTLKGLCSIPPVRGNIVRPLIDCTRTEIEKYCADNGISYVTDSTNLEDEYTRNKFRHHVIATVSGINPSFESNALRCIESINEDNEFLHNYAENEMHKFLTHDGKLYIADRSVPIAVLKRILAVYFESNAAFDFENKHICFITDNRFSDFSLNLPSDKRFSCKDGYLFCDIAEKSDKAESLTSAEYCKGNCFTVKTGLASFRISYSDSCPDYSETVFVADADKIGECVTARCRTSGDEIRISRRRCSKTLRKLYSELKIPIENREKLLVLSDDNGLIFAEYAGIDSSRKPDKATKRYMIIIRESMKDEK